MNAQSTAALVLISSATGFIGLGVGYMIAQKKLTAEFEERLERETNAVRRLYGAVKVEIDEIAHVTDEQIEKIEVPEPVVELITQYAGEKRTPIAYDKIVPTKVREVEPEEVPEPQQKNVFQERDNRGEVYVITPEEFEEGEPEYPTTTLTYYAIDGVVTDVHEDIIEDYDTILGAEFVKNFAEDQTVHVRNEDLCIDYEIIRSPSSYVKEVLGEEPAPELPSGRPRPQRASDRIHGG